MNVKISLVLTLRNSLNVIFAMITYALLIIYDGYKRLAQSNGSRNKKMNGDAPDVEGIYVSWIENVMIVSTKSIERGREKTMEQNRATQIMAQGYV